MKYNNIHKNIYIYIKIGLTDSKIMTLVPIKCQQAKILDMETINLIFCFS